jgi:hypothetical protein
VQRPTRGQGHCGLAAKQPHVSVDDRMSAVYAAVPTQLSSPWELIAQDLIAHTQRLALDGELALCEPKTLRYRLLHTAARLAFHARKAMLRLQRTWPWAHALAAAFARLAALPPPPH